MNVTFPGKHRRVLIDTSVWIYHIEQHPQFAAPAGKVVESLQGGKFRGITSELALLELTVDPLKLGRQNVADEYELLVGYFPHLDLIPIDRDILIEAAGLRAHYKLRTPDAIQLGTALRSGATLAISNDEGWRNLPFMETLILSDLIEKR